MNLEFGTFSNSPIKTSLLISPLRSSCIAPGLRTTRIWTPLFEGTSTHPKSPPRKLVESPKNSPSALRHGNQYGSPQKSNDFIFYNIWFGEPAKNVVNPRFIFTEIQLPNQSAYIHEFPVLDEHDEQVHDRSSIASLLEVSYSDMSTEEQDENESEDMQEPRDYSPTLRKSTQAIEELESEDSNLVSAYSATTPCKQEISEDKYCRMIPNGPLDTDFRIAKKKEVNLTRPSRRKTSRTARRKPKSLIQKARAYSFKSQAEISTRTAIKHCARIRSEEIIQQGCTSRKEAKEIDRLLQDAYSVPELTPVIELVRSQFPQFCMSFVQLLAPSLLTTCPFAYSSDVNKLNYEQACHIMGSYIHRARKCNKLHLKIVLSENMMTAIDEATSSGESLSDAISIMHVKVYYSFDHQYADLPGIHSTAGDIRGLQSMNISEKGVSIESLEQNNLHIWLYIPFYFENIRTKPHEPPCSLRNHIQIVFKVKGVTTPIKSRFSPNFWFHLNARGEVAKSVQMSISATDHKTGIGKRLNTQCIEALKTMKIQKYDPPYFNFVDLTSNPLAHNLTREPFLEKRKKEEESVRRRTKLSYPAQNCGQNQEPQLDFRSWGKMDPDTRSPTRSKLAANESLGASPSSSPFLSFPVPYSPLPVPYPVYYHVPYPVFHYPYPIPYLPPSVPSILLSLRKGSRNKENPLLFPSGYYAATKSTRHSCIGRTKQNGERSAISIKPLYKKTVQNTRRYIASNLNGEYKRRANTYSASSKINGSSAQKKAKKMDGGLSRSAIKAKDKLEQSSYPFPLFTPVVSLVRSAFPQFCSAFVNLLAPHVANTEDFIYSTLTNELTTTNISAIMGSYIHRARLNNKLILKMTIQEKMANNIRKYLSQCRDDSVLPAITSIELLYSFEDSLADLPGVLLHEEEIRSGGITTVHLPTKMANIDKIDGNHLQISLYVPVYFERLRKQRPQEPPCSLRNHFRFKLKVPGEGEVCTKISPNFWFHLNARGEVAKSVQTCVHQLRANQGLKRRLKPKCIETINLLYIDKLSPPYIFLPKIFSLLENVEEPNENDTTDHYGDTDTE